MNVAKLVCWKCGCDLAGIPLPLRRIEECPKCVADLHVCVMCEFYDTSLAKQCREPVAEDVKEKKRANFCDYFKIKPGAYRPQRVAEAEAARAQLEALFGGAPLPKTNTAGDSRSAAEIAREQLEALFKKNGQ